MSAQAWGRLPTAAAEQELEWASPEANLPATRAGTGLLAHGLGRSYGDVALNSGGTLLLTRGLNRVLAFDPVSGVLRAEAGMSLDEILRRVLPLGWFLPVTPGTRFVTLGGAVANDVHGKNHHRAGSFGEHVRALELLRSDGSRRLCSPTHNADWLRATIGGLGLTGLITWVEIGLRRVTSADVWAHNRRFASLGAYWELDAEWTERSEYSVTWVDCLRGGRGIFSAADHVQTPAEPRPMPARPRELRFTPPLSLINRWTVRAFNSLYFKRPLPQQALTPWPAYFYPLDALGGWNRVYGPRGFVQYQCVLPSECMREASRALFAIIGRHGQGSFLAVFKTFGSRPAPGLLSFARPGATLALDFPHRGQATLKLCDELDAVVREAGGALYPAKDARMSPAMFRLGYPQLEAFSAFVDPAFSSNFWRRVMG